MNQEMEQVEQFNRELDKLIEGQKRSDVGGEQALVLASELLSLKDQIVPKPKFKMELAAELKKQAELKERVSRGGFYQQKFFSWFKEIVTMKTKNNIVGAFAALLILLFGGWFFMNRPMGDGGEQVALVTPSATKEVDGNKEPTPLPTSDPKSLPLLPGLGSTGSAGGFGGGGGLVDTEAASSDSKVGMPEIGMMPMIIWNPLEGATFVLNAGLPKRPTVATLYQLDENSASFNIDQVIEFGKKFGMNGAVYTDVYPYYEEGADWTPPTYYHMFDGRRTLSFYDMNLDYYDNTGTPNVGNIEFMEGEAAMRAAEKFLQERGLLNFPYEVTEMYGSVLFNRVIDGYTTTQAEITVMVGVNGQPRSIYYTPRDQMVGLGNYPLISASNAWDQVLQGEVDYHHIMVNLYPTEEGMVQEPNQYEDIYRYWQREYRDGDQFAGYVFPNGYKAVANGDEPYVMVNGIRVIADKQELDQLVDAIGSLIYIEGIMRGDSVTGQSLELTSWELLANQEYPQTYFPGTIKMEEGEVRFYADQGDILVVPSAPTDLTDGERVYLNSWGISKQESGYPKANWVSIERLVEYPEEVMPIEGSSSAPMPIDGDGGPMPIDGEMDNPYQITEIEITEIDMIYWPVYQYPEYEEGEISVRAVPTMIFQPVWRFRGVGSNSQGGTEKVEILVVAVSPEFIEGK